jgi:CheY-like chemotaxis protein
MGWGYRVSTAATPEEALAGIADAVPDLMVVDYRLPGEASGAEAIGALRARAGRRIPALVITGDTAPDRLKEAQSSGYPLLHKPVQPAKLRNTLRNLAKDGRPQGGPAS